MENISRNWLVLALFASTAASAAPTLQTYHYWVRASQTGQSCQEDALRLAKRFSEATSAKVTEAKCLGTTQISADGKSYGLNALDVTYQAPAAVSPYTAVLGEGDDIAGPSDDSGAYTTFAECLADLDAQAALYQGQTGLKPVIARCEQASTTYGAPYVLKVDGFGEPVARLHATSFEYYGQPDESFHKQGLDMITASGATIARTWGKYILYYSKGMMPVKHRKLFTFESVSQCQEQLDVARAILTKDGATSVVAGCLPLADELLKGLISMEVTDNAWGELSTDFALDSPKYFSYGECMDDRQRMLENATSKAGSPDEILGGICHPSDMNKAVYVFEIFRPL